MSSVFVVMGVSGSGKSTVGIALADALNAPFYDGDDYHPPENVAKMVSGQPLNDDDRRPWLAQLRKLISQHLERDEIAVIACSALKRIYRDQLQERDEAVKFVFLQGTFDLIWARMQARQDHFMKPEMLRSQFATLEAPAADEAIIVDIDQSVAAIVSQLVEGNPN